MRFHLLDGIEHDTDGDQKGRAAKERSYEIRDFKPGHDKIRKNSDKRHKDGPGQRQARHHIIQIFCRRLSRPDPGNKPAVFFHVLRYIQRIKNNSRVKIAKENDQHRVEKRIGPVATHKAVGEILERPVRYKRSDGRRKQDDRLRKDDRDDTGLIDL